jgi:AcrR family transcriptional regulator
VIVAGPSRDEAVRSAYHHGNLRQALVDAGTALAVEGGPASVVLREATRRAGVSHTAAYRHFADREALLGAVALEAMGALAEAMADAVARAGTPRERLRAVGATYVSFALARPGVFQAAFSGHGHAAREMSAAGRATPLDILGGVLDDLVAAGDVSPQRRAGAEIVAWSAVHGLAQLVTDGPLAALDPARREGALALVLDRIEDALAGSAAS